MGQILRYGAGIATSVSQTEPKFLAESLFRKDSVCLLEMNVSFQSTSSSKEVCNHELVIKYKVRHVFLYLPAPAQEGKEKRENRTVMTPSLRADG